MAEQVDMFDGNVYWFHVFQSMIVSGDVAKIGPHATTLYLVIKAHSNYKHGKAFPSIDTLVRLSGVSKRTIYNSLDTLVEHGYLSIEKPASGDKRRNIYRLREKVHLDSESDSDGAVASWDYSPSSTKDAVSELRNFIATGIAGEGSHVTIENLNIQMITAEAGSQVVAINSIHGDKLDALSQEEAMKKIREVLHIKPKK